MEKLIANDFQYGADLKMGHGVIIEPNVIVGNSVKIGHRVTLKSGTRISNNSIVDDHCITTGACIIGANVNIRTGAIISKATIIEDWTFIGPGVITNHTKNVIHGRRDKIVNEQLLTYIGFGSIVGSQASLLAGIYIKPQCIIGGGSVVVKDLIDRGIYVGCPCKRVGNLPTNYIMDEPHNSGTMYLRKEVMDYLAKNIPSINYSKYEDSMTITRNPMIDCNSNGDHCNKNETIIQHLSVA